MPRAGIELAGRVAPSFQCCPVGCPESFEMGVARGLAGPGVEEVRDVWSVSMGFGVAARDVSAASSTGDFPKPAANKTVEGVE